MRIIYETPKREGYYEFATSLPLALDAINKAEGRRSEASKAEGNSK